MSAAVVALAVAVLLLGVLVAGLLRSHAEILKALHELGAGLELDRAEGGPVPVTIDGVRTPRSARTSGAAAPEAITGSTTGGETVAIPLRGHDTLVAFLSSGCTTCQAFWEAFAEGPVDVPGGARLVVVTKSLDEESASALAARAPRTLTVVHSSVAWESFGVPGSPYFAYVDAAGSIVGEGSAATWPAVATLMRQAHDDRAHDDPAHDDRAHDDRAHDDGALQRQRGRAGRDTRDTRDAQALAAAGIGPGHDSLRP